MRPLMEKAYEALVEDDTIPIVVAPTSYGKTRASPEIWRRASDMGYAWGLIHVAPLRSLVRSIYNDHFSTIGGGYQYHASGSHGGKSPYFLRQPVVTTLDSFLWNFYRIPVAEFVKVERRLSGGHYYPLHSAIFSSISVFDEAHLYLSETGRRERGMEAMKAAVSVLAWSGAPIIIETATLTPPALGGIVDTILEKGARKTTILLLDTSSCNNSGPEGERYIESLKGLMGDYGDLVTLSIVKDNHWIETHCFTWETRLFNSEEAFIREAVKSSEDQLVLIVRNTVENAIQTYRQAREIAEKGHCGDPCPCLIHGRLSEADRRRAEDCIEQKRRQGKGLIVATMVAEAGVDINAHRVYTDPAPMENLIQRANRGCRRDPVLKHCREEGGYVGILRPSGHDASILGPYEAETVDKALSIVERRLNEGKEINWRLSLGLLDEASAPETRRIGDPLSTSLKELYKTYLVNDATPQSLMDTVLSKGGACSLVGSTVMVKIYIDEMGHDYVLADLEWLKYKGKKFLSQENGRYRLLLILEGTRTTVYPVDIDWSERSLCDIYRDITRKLYKEQPWKDMSGQEAGKRARLAEWGFLADGDSYVEGMGLVGK